MLQLDCPIARPVGLAHAGGVEVAQRITGAAPDHGAAYGGDDRAHQRDPREAQTHYRQQQPFVAAPAGDPAGGRAVRLGSAAIWRSTHANRNQTPNTPASSNGSNTRRFYRGSAGIAVGGG